jgi:alanine dehydrogenase
LNIGVVREIKNNENRVALTPAGVDRLRSARHEVFVETQAGVGSGLSDDAYKSAGASIASDAKTVFAKCDLVLKVKEPQKSEWALMRRGQTLFTYFHLAADRELTTGVMKTGAHCFAYETLEHAGSLPLLTPMSEVAGRMAIQAGAKFLEAPAGGSGILLGGVPGVRPANVLVLGGGVVGTQTARMAAGLGADVTVMDINLDRMRYLDEILPHNCRTIFSTPLAVREALAQADLVIGAVLVPGAAAPKLVKRADLRLIVQGLSRLTSTGRMHRDRAPDDPRRADVRGRRRRALLRGEHARSRAAHEHVRAHERDVAVDGEAGRARARARGAREHRARQRGQRPRRTDHVPRGRGRVRLAVRAGGGRREGAALRARTRRGLRAGTHPMEDRRRRA